MAIRDGRTDGQRRKRKRTRKRRRKRMRRRRRIIRGNETLDTRYFAIVVIVDPLILGRFLVDPCGLPHDGTPV